MKDRPKDSSASKTTEVPAVFLVVYTELTCAPQFLPNGKWGTKTFNTFDDALDFASTHVDHLNHLEEGRKKNSVEEDLAASEDARCAIYQRVCCTKGTTTQTVHLIS